MVAHALAGVMYKKGYCYKKTSVGLLDLTAGSVVKGDLFSGVDTRSQTLMDISDKANQKFGCVTVGFASSGCKQKTGFGYEPEDPVAGLHFEMGPVSEG